ncbi:MAG: division/cell wall cluster transcriptional repressor MraZ [Candidatus Neomarinimicrobiota bacterium]|nr:MAG: division/cell wall cluster transcriptional repressor MraZ [Candidatus Marinimicrobia bacterium TMED108]|tara:strand:- start:878 stop:1342 length:465 start_codon:yes stop_codon:yes gene_type:complete
MTLNKNTFIGEYSYTIDAKGRINIPSKFRNSLSKDNKSSLVVTRGMDKCVWVYPLIVWKSIEDELRKLSSLSSINRSFIRNTVRHASITKLDKQGRISLNQNLISFSSITKNALIIGMVNKIEIWDPSYLLKIDNNFNDIDSTQFDELSDKIIL